MELEHIFPLTGCCVSKKFYSRECHFWVKAYTCTLHFLWWLPLLCLNMMCCMIGMELCPETWYPSITAHYQSKSEPTRLMKGYPFLPSLPFSSKSNRTCLGKGSPWAATAQKDFILWWSRSSFSLDATSSSSYGLFRSRWQGFRMLSTQQCQPFIVSVLSCWHPINLQTNDSRSFRSFSAIFSLSLTSLYLQRSLS